MGKWIWTHGDAYYHTKGDSFKIFKVGAHQFGDDEFRVFIEGEQDEHGKLYPTAKAAIAEAKRRALEFEKPRRGDFRSDKQYFKAHDEWMHRKENIEEAV